MSGDIYAEYEEVIRRPQFNRSDSEIEATLRTIRERGLWVRPTEKVLACSDPTTTFSWSAHRLRMPITWSPGI
jgi:hypothetical protein